MSTQNMVGKKNVYICANKHLTVTVDKDPGVTPWVIKCPEEGCGADAKSQMYPVGFDGPATYEWRLPTHEELYELAKAHGPKIGVEDIDGITEAVEILIGSGNLVLYKILVPGVDTLEGVELGNRRAMVVGCSDKPVNFVGCAGSLTKNYGNTGTHKTAKPGTTATNTDARRRLGGRKYGKLSTMKTMAQEITKPVPKQGRNEICACGSGLKFKRCCGKN